MIDTPRLKSAGILARLGKMSPDETMVLLELLYRNRDSVYGAAGGEEYKRHRREVQATLSQDQHSA